MLRSQARIVVVMAVSGAVACGSEVVEDASPNDPTNEPAGQCTSLDVGGLRVSATTSDGGEWICDDVADDDIVVEGMVSYLGGGTWIVDSCPPLALCEGSTVTTLFVAGWTGDVPNFDGAYVRATAEQQSDEAIGCWSQTLVIENLPEWEGVANSLSGGSHLWIVANAGPLRDYATLEIEVSECGPPPENYWESRPMHMLVSGSDGEPQLIASGESAQVDGYRVTNVDCDFGGGEGGPYCDYTIAYVSE